VTTLGIIVDLKSGMKTEAILATRDPVRVTSRSSGLMLIPVFWTLIFGANSVDGVPGYSWTSISMSIPIFLTSTLTVPVTVIKYL